MPHAGRLALALLASLTLAAAARADDQLAAAEQAYADSAYARARDLAHRAAGTQPAKAWRLIGASSCFLKDRSGALDALSHLPGGPDIEFLRFACARNGIELTVEEIAVWSSPARLLVTEAQSAYAEGKHGDAKRLALQAVQLDPKLAPAWRVLGAAACWTRDKGNAQRACDHLQPIDQEVVRTTCARTLGGRLDRGRVVRKSSRR